MVIDMMIFAVMAYFYKSAIPSNDESKDIQMENSTGGKVNPSYHSD
jgi:hypothetical protein